MTMGAHITNEAGSVIISESFRNYHLHSRGVTVNSHALPTLGAGQQLVVRPNGATGRVFRSFSGGAFIKSDTGSVSWAILQESFGARVENFGLEVRSPNGVVFFDSGRRSLHPVLNASVNQGSSGFIRSVISLPPIALAGRIRYVNSGSINFSGFAPSEVAHFSRVRGSDAIWNSDTSISIGEGLSDGMGPRGVATTWSGVFLFSFVDV